MTKKIFIIFLYIFFLTKFVFNEPVIPNDDKKNYIITQEAMGFLDKIEDLKNGKASTGDDEDNKEGKDSSNDNNKDSHPDIEVIENTGLFQGDEMLTEQQADEIVDEAVDEAVKDKIDVSKILNNDTKIRRKRKIDASMVKSPWKFPINYYVAQGDRTLIDKALKIMEEETCVRFQKRYNTVVGQPGLKYIRGAGCWSYVGKKEEYKFQNVVLGNECDSIAIIQHETMHALGSTHEHCRADRDEYLKVFYDRVKNDQLKNFEKLNNSDAITYNIPYEYGSDMHYDSLAFSNGKTTMLPHDLLFSKTIGIIAGMTFLDAKLLNFHYCLNICAEKIDCYNGGYQDPNNCNVCKCVEGYDGNSCNKLPAAKGECGRVFYNTQTSEQSMVVSGEKNCLYHLKAPHGMKIKIYIKTSNFDPFYDIICIKGNSLEVKMTKDKTTTGALFCGPTNNITIMSENEHVILHYRSTNEVNWAEITYQTV